MQIAFRRSYLNHGIERNVSTLSSLSTWPRPTVSYIAGSSFVVYEWVFRVNVGAPSSLRRTCFYPPYLLYSFYVYSERIVRSRELIEPNVALFFWETELPTGWCFYYKEDLGNIYRGNVTCARDIRNAFTYECLRYSCAVFELIDVLTFLYRFEILKGLNIEIGRVLRCWLHFFYCWSLSKVVTLLA